MNFTPVGLVDLTDENSFILYPNPASTKCIVQSSRIKVGDAIRIFAVMGKEILYLDKSNSEISMQEFPLFAQIGFVKKGETYIFAGHQ